MAADKDCNCDEFEDLKKQKRAMMKKINLAKKKVESLKDMEQSLYKPMKTRKTQSLAFHLLGIISKDFHFDEHHANH